MLRTHEDAPQRAARHTVERLRLTPARIESLPAPADRPQRFTYDTEVPTLAVRVTRAGGKAYVVNMWSRTHGKRICYAIGACSQVPLSDARDLAREITVAVTRGENPVADRRAQRVALALDRTSAVTLKQCYQDYLAARKDLAPRTRYDYRQLMASYLADWAALPIAALTKDMIERRHAEIGQGALAPVKRPDGTTFRMQRTADGAPIGSPARANYAMRFLRALFNFAQDKYEVDGQPIITLNPVKRLSKARAWYADKRRTRYIKPGELPAWFAGVLAVKSDVGRDYLQLLILTGLRRNEALLMRVADVDLKARAFTVRDTKNGRDHELPMSDYLHELFERRLKAAAGSPWVFPAADTRSPFAEPKRSIEQAITNGAPAFSAHDLRRTFATVVASSHYLGRSLSVYEIKQLLNHAVRDVTGGYVQLELEQLRPAMQAVTDFVLKAAGVRESAQVVNLDERRAQQEPRGAVNAA
jgi:integrase